MSKMSLALEIMYNLALNLSLYKTEVVKDKIGINYFVIERLD